MKIVAWLILFALLTLFGLVKIALPAEVPIIWTDVNPTGRVTNFTVWNRVGNGQRVKLDSTTNRFATLTNINVALSNSLTVSCSATNTIESDESLPLVLPPIVAPNQVSNRYAGFTWTVPVGASLHRSFDLSNWREYIRNFGTQPMTFRIFEMSGGAMQFFKVVTNPPAIMPPLP